MQLTIDQIERALVASVTTISYDGTATGELHPALAFRRAINDVLAEDGATVAGTHAYDMMAAVAEEEAATTETLMHLIAAVVLMKARERALPAWSVPHSVTFSALDIDEMLKQYTMTSNRDGMLTTVAIAKRAVPATVAVMNQDEDGTGALPQAEPRAEMPYWFARSGSGTLHPFSREEAERHVRKWISEGELTAQVENRACARADCPNSAQQACCALCTPV